MLHTVPHTRKNREMKGVFFPFPIAIVCTDFVTFSERGAL